MRVWAGVAVALWAGAAGAEDFWSYRDWWAAVERVETGEDTRVLCAIGTGGDGGPSLRAEVSNGDALPPTVYPAIALHESAPRHHPTQLRDGDTVRLVFDTGAMVDAAVRGGIDDEGLAYATAAVRQADAQAVLREMRAAGQIDVMRGGDLVLAASLDGFTAAYGKMAEQCGFTTAGVID